MRSYTLDETIGGVIIKT